MAESPQAQAPNKTSPFGGTPSSMPGGVRLSPHFTLEEMTRTNTGLENEPGLALAGNMAMLVEALESIRELLGVPLKINSGYRSDKVNRAVKGSENSEHRFARAADFVPQGMDLREAFNAIRKSGLVWNQLILEPNWIHFSVPPRREAGKQEVMEAHMDDAHHRMSYFHV